MIFIYKIKKFRDFNLFLGLLGFNIYLIIKMYGVILVNIKVFK